MRSFFLSLFILGAWLLPQSTMGQCIPDSTVPSKDGIYPSSLDLPGCQFFDTTVTFILPRDTTAELTPGGPVVTAPFVAFTVDSITGLPDGINWECNLAPACRYVVHPDSTQDDTIGCISFFGTANIPSFYNVTVHLTAEFVLFGQTVAQPSTLSAPFTIQPCSFTGDCYTLNLDSNCEPAALSIENNILSNGRSGFDYSWSITSTNGFDFTSTDENPPAQVLSQAGDYFVDYAVEIDTIGYSIIDARINTVNCTDLLDAGDIYWYFIAPNGDTLANTFASPITNGGNNLPIFTGISTSILDSGAYILQVWDFDNLQLDNGCATNGRGTGAALNLTIPPPSGDSLTVTNSGLSVTFFFNNPIQTISCSDTISILPLPASPALVAGKDTLSSPAEVEWCVTSELTLSAVGDSIEWFFNGNQIASREGSFEVSEGGTYEAMSVSLSTFCRSVASTITVIETSVPAPAVVRVADTIFVGSPSPQLTYNWFDLAGNQVGQGVSFNPASSGDFFAVAVEAATGCQSLGSDTIRLFVTSLEEFQSGSISLYPNPANDFLTLKTQLFNHQSAKITLRDLVGRSVKTWEHEFQPGEDRLKLDLGGIARGIFLLEVEIEDSKWTRKVAIER